MRKQTHQAPRPLLFQPASFILILALYFALHVAVRLAVSTTLEHDEAQQVFLSQYMAIGYDGQPPLYNWLQTLVISVFGVSRASLAVLKNILLFSTYILFWMTARHLLREKALAIVATLGLLTLPQLGFESQRDLTHTVAVFFSAALFFYAMVRTIDRPTLFGYMLAGIAVGIGGLSKYNFLLLPVAVCIAMLMDQNLRRRVLDLRILATVAIAAAIILPHALWFLQNMDVATERTLGKMTSETSYLAGAAHGIGSLLVAIIGFCALTTLCFYVTFGKAFKSALFARNDWTNLIERAFAIIAIVLVLIILLGQVDSVRDRWLAPYLVIYPLYVCLKIKAAGLDIEAGARRFGLMAAVFMAAIPALLFLRIATAGMTGEYQYINAPFAALARDIAARTPEPSVLITEETHVGGNLRLQMPGVPVVALTYPAFSPVFTWTRDHPAVFVWRERKGRTPPPLPDELIRWLETYGGSIAKIENHTLSLPYLYGAPDDAYQFAYAVAYP